MKDFIRVTYPDGSIYEQDISTLSLSNDRLEISLHSLKNDIEVKAASKIERVQVTVLKDRFG